MNRTYTRRLSKVLNDLDDEFKSMCDTSAFARKLTQLKSSPKSARPSILSELYEMLDRCGISYEIGQSNEYYERLVNMSEISDAEDIERRMLNALFSKFHEFPTPEQYMLRIVDALSSSSDGWDNDTLRLRILKQFIKYGNYLYDANYEGRMTVRKYAGRKFGRAAKDDEVLANLDDGIFACLENTTKEERKKYALIKLADDLASGKFRTSGATKKGLYMFAMVYGMTYSSDLPDRIFDADTDIEKNLFTDYYTNNLMRFMSEAYKKELAHFEIDPSGQGINYKNFVEMVCLYFISNDYTPQEKIMLSSRMITELQNFEPSQEEISSRDTMAYKELFTEEILALPEDEFKKFIGENYNCKTGGTVGGIQLETEQNTAFAEYQRIIRKLKTLLQSEHKDEEPFDLCRYGLWFTDINSLRENMNILGEADEQKRENFFTLLEAVNDFLVSGSALNVKSPVLITRTSILVAWYYYFNAIHEGDAQGIWDSFESLYDAFKAGIDPILESSGYQLLNGRNIFDLLITFSSYSYVNL